MTVRQTTNSLPGELQSPRGKLVYLYLLQTGGGTVADLRRALDLDALTLYSVLKTLRDRDLVQKEANRFVTVRPV
jgi:DNA-binding MarR family transcriptional regulator